MDTKTLIKKLKEVFAENNKGDKKYSLIWLSPLVYGGLYYSKDFALNLKAEHEIKRYLTEITEISTILRGKAKEETKSILRIKIYSSNETVELKSDDYVVYEEVAAIL